MAQQQTQEEFQLMQQMAGKLPEKNNLIAVFSMEPVELSEGTKEERRKVELAALSDAVKAGKPAWEPKFPESILGRPFYEEQEFITIYIPGDKDNVIFRPIRNVDKVQYGEQYRAFKANKEQPITGTPVDQLPFMSKSQCLELSYFGIRTVEQLVATSDVNGQKIVGWAALKSRAQTFLDAAAGAAPAAALQAELEKRDNEIDTLKKALAEQGKQIQAISNRKG